MLRHELTRQHVFVYFLRHITMFISTISTISNISLSLSLSLSLPPTSIQ